MKVVTALQRLVDGAPSLPCKPVSVVLSNCVPLIGELRQHSLRCWHQQRYQQSISRPEIELWSDHTHGKIAILLFQQNSPSFKSIRHKCSISSEMPVKCGGTWEGATTGSLRLLRPLHCSLAHITVVVHGPLSFTFTYLHCFLQYVGPGMQMFAVKNCVGGGVIDASRQDLGYEERLLVLTPGIWLGWNAITRLSSRSCVQGHTHGLECWPRADKLHMPGYSWFSCVHG